MNIIDRRLNPGGKSFANRQRFLRRARAQVRKAVREASSSRSIKDAGKGGEVSIPAGGVHEPHLHRSGQGGVRDCARDVHEHGGHAEVRQSHNAA